MVEVDHLTQKQKEEIEESDKLSIGYESRTTMSHILSEVIISMWYPVADLVFPEGGYQIFINQMFKLHPLNIGLRGVLEFFTNSPQYKNANVANFVLGVP